MRLEFDEQGYVYCILYGCSTGSCVEYTGLVPSQPEEYTDIDDWANRAQTQAYKLDSDGNLTYDAEKASELANSDNGKLLWSGASQMGVDGEVKETITLAEPVSNQLTGISLVFSRYVDDAAQNYGFHSFFVSKHLVATYKNYTTFSMASVRFDAIGCKYLAIRDETIIGHAANTESGAASGITYDNQGYVLRYVYGV